MLVLKHRHQGRGIAFWRLTGFICLIVAGDQLTKAAARNHLAHSDHSWLGGLVTFSLIENHEGFLGMVRGLPPGLQFLFLYICVGLMLAGCLCYLFIYPRPNPRYSLPLGLVTGGGLSNLLDRILHHGGVTDFVILGSGGLRTGIFNLADVAIFLGSVLFGFLLFSRLGK